MIARSTAFPILCVVAAAAALGAAQPSGLQIADLSTLRMAFDVHLSPDASRVAYAVINQDRPGRPYSQVWIMDVATRGSTRLGDVEGRASSPRWSHDGRSIAYIGSDGGRTGLMVAARDGSNARFIAPVDGTNAPLPTSGSTLTWSPDDRRIAFVSSTPGPEPDVSGDPMVITRYLYKPTASEGLTHFNDNRRLHLFVAALAGTDVRQLTKGDYYEHSIDWAPSGERILFVSNREPDPDRVFNYDLFTVDASSGDVARLTDTKSAEYDPVWSPDGRRIAYLATKRRLTSSETTMEDTHVWTMNADGSETREVGGGIDNRQGPPQWISNETIGTSVQERGESHVYDAAGATRLIADAGSIVSWSAAGGRIAYALATRAAPADLFIGSAALKRPPFTERRLTTLNAERLAGRAIAPVESFTFESVDGTPIEAFLTKPVVQSGKTPLIVEMHGGPHGQQGPAFNSKAQMYAAHGFATLMVNYRGSTGYGQKLADAIFGDQGGGEAKDVLAGVDAALRRYPWLDGSRLGLEGVSYGGQLTNWIVTQTDRFKAAIAISGISNLVTQNYLAYYHDYLAVEFGGYPHEKGINDRLWERSPIRYVANAKTPVMFVHGENDNDVPIAEAEQFYIALKDVGVETVMLRYPREGHGISEVGHTQDLIRRSLDWYDRHFRRD